MFVIGKASDEEIQEMKGMGFDVEPVDVLHFDQALDPNFKLTQENEEIYNENRQKENRDQLVAVFLDCDIVQECKNIHAEEIKKAIAGF